jgi:hypothetical protein
MHFGIRAHSIKLPVSPRPIPQLFIDCAHICRSVDVDGSSTPEGRS